MSSRESKKQRQVIYDFGANNGDDLPYYLKKASLVVAVEANPALAIQMAETFADQVRTGHLVVENLAVTEAVSDLGLNFYIHTKKHVLSTLVKPLSTQRADYKKISVPSLSVEGLIRRHGPPFFVKIDLESYEVPVLRGLFSNQIFPEFISVEGHDPAVFGILLGS